MAATIAIIGALEQEVRHIYDALGDPAWEERGGLRIARGTLGGREVVATVAGMGTVNVAAATQLLLSVYDAGTVIFSGIAGGLNPALHIDDIVIGERLRYTDTDTALIAESAPGLEEFASTPELVDLAEQVLRARGYAAIEDGGRRPVGTGNAAAEATADTPAYLRGTIATGNRFVTGDALRAAVVAETAADCAEMEGAAVAHIAAKNGGPIMADTINYQRAHFVASYGKASQIPPSTCPEVSFVGRSNVGKSSIMNKLFGRKGLVKVSSTPGKTSNVNFFEADGVHFVDLPGYGFARRSKAERDRWAQLIGDFFDLERSFNLVVSLVDIRHDPSALDHQMIEFLQEGEFPFVVALTKADKLSRNKQNQQLAAIRKQLNVPAEDIIVTSSQSGQGIDELKRRIEAACL